jgi:hypothetical protein
VSLDCPTADYWLWNQFQAQKPMTWADPGSVSVWRANGPNFPRTQRCYTCPINASPSSSWTCWACWSGKFPDSYWTYVWKQISETNDMCRPWMSVLRAYGPQALRIRDTQYAPQGFINQCQYRDSLYNVYITILDTHPKSSWTNTQSCVSLCILKAWWSKLPRNTQMFYLSY